MIYATWIAWTSDGRGYLFKAPEDYSKAMAIKVAEKLYNTLFVTVHQL